MNLNIFKQCLQKCTNCTEQKGENLFAQIDEQHFNQRFCYSHLKNAEFKMSQISHFRYNDDTFALNRQ